MNFLPLYTLVIYSCFCGIHGQNSTGSSATQTTVATTTSATFTTTKQILDQGILLTGYPKGFDPRQISLLLTTPDELTTYGGVPPGVQFGNFEVGPASCALDYRQKNLLLFDYYQSSLLLGTGLSTSISEDSMNFTYIHYGVAGGRPGLAVDWISHNVYWIDLHMNWIAMQPGWDTGDTTLYKVIVHGGSSHKPRGLSIDPNKGYLFYATVDPSTVQRRDLLGGNAKTLKTGLMEPNDVAVDTLNKRVYWIDEFGISWIDYEGFEGSHNLGRDYTHTFTAIEIFKGFVMVTDDDGDLTVFNGSSSPLTKIGETYSSADEYFQDIAMYHEDAQPMINNGSACQTKGCQELCLALAPSFEATCLCREGSYLDDDGLSCVVADGVHNRAILFTDGTNLCRIDIRLITDFHQSFIDTMDCFYEHSGSDPILFLELNMAAREVYFADKSKLYRVYMDMTDPIPENFLTAEGEIGGMSYDWMDNNLYLTDTKENKIGVISMADLSLDYFSLITNEPGEIIVLPHHNTVFWTSTLNETHSEVNMADLAFDETRKEAIEGRPKVAFEINGYVRSINYTGGDFSRLEYMQRDAIVFSLYQEYFLEMMEANGETEFSSNRIGIYYGGTAGTLQKDDVNIGVVTDVVIFDPLLQHPYPSPCGYMNGECEQLCLPNGPNRVCHCSKGFILLSDGKSCQSTLIDDHFILVVDKTLDVLFQIPLDDDLPIQGVKTSDKGTLRGVMYNFLTNKILWSSYTTDQIVEIGMNGTDERILLDTYGDLYRWANPDRAVLDPSTGYIYYTGASWFGFPGDSYIGVLAPDGGHTTLPISETLASPRDLQIDAERGLLFWVDISLSYAGVYRANMDGSNSVQIVSSAEVEGPAGIALDRQNQMFYFTDGYADKIYSCSYTCNEDIVEIHDEPGSSLEDVALNGGYLYVTGWNLPYLLRLNTNSINDITRLRQMDGLGRMNAMDLYRSQDIIKPHGDCSVDNGGCSHFCLPTTLGHTCACEDDYYLLPGSTRICENIPRCSVYIENANLTETCLGLTETTCSFTCIENFRLKPGEDFNVMCTNNLTWDSPSPCEEILCTDIIPNGALSVACPLNVGSVCGEYTCNEGFEPSPGIGNMTCKPDGTWSITLALLCERKCPTGITSGTLQEDCGRDPGEMCTFECDRTYKPLNNNSEILCKSDSDWNRDTTMVCEEILCTDIIPNGALSVACPLNVGSVCGEYTCNEGFEPSPGIGNMTCKPDGTWSITLALLCERKCPTGITSGTLQEDCGRDPGEMCTFECDRTYKPLNNNSEILCKSDSDWNRDTTMVCEEILCPSVKGLAVMEYGCTRKVDARCLYSCVDNYTINMDVIHQTCQLSGKWNHTANPDAPLCLPPVTQPPTVVPDETKYNTAVAITVAVIVILFLVIMVLTIMLCRTKGVSMPHSSHSMKYYTGNTPGIVEGAVGIENPQYVDLQATGDANQQNKDFGYTTLDNDKIELTVETNRKL